MVHFIWKKQDWWQLFDLALLNQVHLQHLVDLLFSNSRARGRDQYGHDWIGRVFDEISSVRCFAALVWPKLSFLIRWSFHNIDTHLARYVMWSSHTCSSTCKLFSPVSFYRELSIFIYLILPPFLRFLMYTAYDIIDTPALQGFEASCSGWGFHSTLIYTPYVGVCRIIFRALCQGRLFLPVQGMYGHWLLCDY